MLKGYFFARLGFDVIHKVQHNQVMEEDLDQVDSHRTSVLKGPATKFLAFLRINHTFLIQWQNFHFYQPHECLYNQHLV